MANAREIFGNRMRIVMAARNMSSVKLSEAIGVGRNTLCNYVNGRGLPLVDVAFDIAKALGVTVDWLCGEGSLEDGLHEQ